MRIDKDNIKIILILLVVALGIGYSYLNTELNINGTANINSANWNVYWNNVQVSNGSVEATTPTIDSNKTTVSFNVTLTKPGDYYEFTVDAVNAGTLDAMIESISSKLNGTSITTLPAYLDYNVTYSDGMPLQPIQELLHDSTETYKVRIAYKDDISASALPETNQSLSLQFSVTYRQVTDAAIAVDHSFSGHSWATIINNVRSGNISNYNVGDTKTVDMGSLGTHTLRIANKSTPSECSTTGFSQSACGFVLEFADIITTHVMNSTSTNVGGWPASEMRTYVNSDIYNELPSELKSGIINTTVVSGHGITAGEVNFTSTDKLYLLSTKEVWGKEGTSSIINEDSAEAETRQLDYYSIKGVTTNNYLDVIKKYNGSNSMWWLRSAHNFGSTSCFFYVRSGGDWDYRDADSTIGVSPAFRIG